MRAALVCVLAMAAAASAAIDTAIYKADIEISDPNVFGVVTGKMTYQYDASFKRRQVVYTINSATVTEIIDFVSQTRWLYCSSCQAETYKNVAEKFFPVATDVKMTGVPDADGCYTYSRDDGSDIKSLRAKDLTGLSSLCSVTYFSTGKTIKFSNFASASEADFMTLEASGPKGWGCPAKVCNIIMDLVLILDESGSITYSQWLQEMNFAKTLISKFTLSPTAVNIGLAFFATESRMISKMESSAGNLNNALTSAGKRGGSTCMSCGTDEAMRTFDTRTSARAALRPARVSILLTDGENNMPEAPYNYKGTMDYWNYLLQISANKLKTTYSVTSMAVVVGVDPKREEFTLIASDPKYVFGVSSYSELAAVIDSLVTATCKDFPAEPCGSACKGFCGCAGSCQCPSKCPTPNGCQLSSCVQGQYFSGCKTVNKTCSADACSIAYCDAATGKCTTTPRDIATYCDDKNPCTDDLCDAGTGCYHKAKACTSTSKCLSMKCDPTKATWAAACVPVNISCSDGKACTKDLCNDATGCYNPVSCDDNDACTNDVCAADGSCSHPAVTCTPPDKCKVAACKKDVGCVYTPLSCDDGNPCTTDSCAPATGCVNTPVTGGCDAALCTALACQPKNKCQTVTCVIVKGATTAQDKAECKYTDKTAVNGTCYSADKCIVNTCDLTTGDCNSVSHYTGYCSPVQKCYVSVCDPSDGGCKEKPVNCTSTDPCMVASCDTTLNKCVYKPLCSSTEACKDVKCVANGATATCVKSDRVCDNPSPCLSTTCDVKTDKCVSVAIPAPAHPFCKVPRCDPVQGWVTDDNPCNDNDPCTTDGCDATIDNCTHKPLCDDGKWCTEDLCTYDAVQGAVCSNPEKVCDLNLTGSESSCYKAVCIENTDQHCVKQILRYAFTNPCGKCIKEHATDSMKSDTTCIGALTWDKAAGAIAGGVIAAIVIAAIIGFLAFSAASAFGTWKLIQMSKAGSGMAAHNNPMYKPSDTESVNPAYVQ